MLTIVNIKTILLISNVNKILENGIFILSKILHFDIFLDFLNFPILHNKNVVKTT